MNELLNTTNPSGITLREALNFLLLDEVCLAVDNNELDTIRGQEIRNKPTESVVLAAIWDRLSAKTQQAIANEWSTPRA